MVSFLISVIMFIITLPMKTVALGVKVAKTKNELEKATGIDKAKKEIKKKSRDSAINKIKDKRNKSEEDSKLKGFVRMSKTFTRNITTGLITLIRSVSLLLASFGIMSTLMVGACTFFLIAAISGVLLSENLVASGSVALGGATSSTTSSTAKGGKGSNADPKNHKVWTIYAQGDSKWGSHPHSTSDPKDSIAYEGCGTCASAMVLAYFTGDDESYTPDKVADIQRKLKIGFPNINNQSVVKIFNEAYKDLGLKAEYFASNKIDLDKLDACLEKGGCAIVDYPHTVNGIDQLWAQGSGHYVVICAGNKKDGYRTVDSNSGHENGTRGVAKYAPYSEQIWAKEFIQPCTYYYLISRK